MGTAAAGSLSLGEPTVEDGHYVFPVVLAGESEVASLNFTLSYDPTRFEPVLAEPGHQAAFAGKQIAANAVAPGTYIVVVLGLNQTAIAAGEVARIGLRPLGTPEGTTRLDLVDTSLASWEGPELPSEGIGRTLDLGGTEPETETETSAEDTANTAGPTPTRVAWTVDTADGSVRAVPLPEQVPGAAAPRVRSADTSTRREETGSNDTDTMVEEPLPEAVSEPGGGARLARPAENQTVEHESNRASVPDASREDASTETGGTVGQTARESTSWLLAAFVAAGALVMVLFRRKLFR